MARIINLLSGPRNISTALMYSFAQRDDVIVVDEPFYAYYLEQTGVDHPGRELVLNSMPSKLEEIIEGINVKAQQGKTIFLKNMGHHMVMEDFSFLLDWENAFLIRNPRQLIASIACILEKPQMRDIALQRQFELYKWLASKTSENPTVMDSSLVMKNPENGLKSFCAALDLPFDSKMLSWPKGPIPEDGIWAKWWYKTVHLTTGFKRQPSSERELPAECVPLFEEAKPYYDFMLNNAIS